MPPPPPSGFNSRTLGVYTDPTSGPVLDGDLRPRGALNMGWAHFRLELSALLQELRGAPPEGEAARVAALGQDAEKLQVIEAFNPPSLGYCPAGVTGAPPPPSSPPPPLSLLAPFIPQAALSTLVLSNDAVWEREFARPHVVAPWVIKAPYYVLCYALDALFDGRPIQRFFFLENVARMPYLSYVTMLHLYETLGWYRIGAQIKRVHFAEEWNEYNHLLIHESLGGDQRWADRFMGQHAALAYYLALSFMWLISPTLSYNFSELIEAHAVDTYTEFLEANEAALQALPPPRIALKYYCGDDMYLFDE